MIKKEIRRIFAEKCFVLKEDPNEWTSEDIRHIASELKRKSKKRNVVFVAFNGIQYVHKKFKRPNYSTNGGRGYRYKNPTNWIQNAEAGRCMEFEISYEIKTHKTSTKNTFELLVAHLVLETI